jgi:hypothetical protein
MFRRRSARAARQAVDEAPSRAALAILEAITTRRGDGLELDPYELPIVCACRRLIASTVAQLPFLAYRDGVPRPDQPAVVVRPDPFEPAWLTKTRLANNLTRNGYVWLRPVAWGAGDEVTAVSVINAPDATATFDPTAPNRILEMWSYGERLEPFDTFDRRRDSLMWVPFDVPERPNSLGAAPLAGCWRAAEYLAALYQMAGSFWEAGFPSLAVLLEQALTPAQRLELKDQLYGAWSRRHEPAIVDRGGRLEPVGSNAVDAQLVESVEWANTEVARAFGVMPSLVNVRAGDSLTYATTEAEFLKWLKVGLGQILTPLEAAFSDLTVRGTQVRADTAALLRSDQAARAAWYQLGLTYGWLTLDEVRAAEGARPLPSPRPLRPPTAITDPPQLAVA